MHKSDLDPRFKILAERPPAAPQAVAALRARFPNVPNEYVEFVSEVTEVELDFLGKCLRIWHPETCADMDEGYEIAERLPGAVPIGDDGGGRVLFYFEGNDGPGLYRVGYGDLAAEDATWVSASLFELLGTGNGMQNL